MQSLIKNWILFGLMLVAAIAAWAFHPTKLLADERPKVELAQLVPNTFGNWVALPPANNQIVNPQGQSLVQKLYADTLSRTYVNTVDGKAIMLSVAYGKNQSDGVALHYPEVCYPAQGFTLLESAKGTLQTPFGTIPVKRLMTKLNSRSEPITYWTTIGDKAVESGLDTKLTQLHFGFHGYIPDGLIFRVSSIGEDVQAGHVLQEAFIQDLLKALPSASRIRLAGLSNSGTDATPAQ